MHEPSITIGYSCLLSQMEGIELPCQNLKVQILIVAQASKFSPSDIALAESTYSDRDDVRVILLESIGVAKSRNAVISAATGDFLFFADDDIQWLPSGISKILNHFTVFPETDLVLSQSINEFGGLRKKSPATRKRLNRYNSAKAATYEIAIRLSSFKSHSIYFNEDFGAGTLNHLGDEYLFILDACVAGLHCEFVPVLTSSHKTISSGVLFGTLNDAQSRAALFRAAFGYFAFFIRIFFAFKHMKKFKSPALILRFVVNIFPKRN